MADPSLYAAVASHVPFDILLLIENSVQLAYVWNDLRDRYIAPLLLRLNQGNATKPATTTVWLLESQPLQTNSTGRPGQYLDPQAALNDVQLNFVPENRISYDRIKEATDFLASLRMESDQPRALHLFLVAASSPSTGALPIDADSSSSLSGFSPWQALAHKLVQANIHCHLLMRSTSEDMSLLSTMFEETRRTQGNVDDLISFTVDVNWDAHLSLSPEQQSQFNNVKPSPRPQRIPMPPRRNTFPLDIGTGAGQYESSSDPYFHQQHQQQQELQHLQDVQQHEQQLYHPHHQQLQEPSPSLVSQLQQVHGLTKKKVYGVKPSRLPFLKDEAGEIVQGSVMSTAYHQMHHHQPTQHEYPQQQQQQQLHHGMLPSPAGAAPVYGHDGTLPPSSGRAMSLSKQDRMARLANAQMSPTASDPQRRSSTLASGGPSAHMNGSWARRGSRVSSPEPLLPQRQPGGVTAGVDGTTSGFAGVASLSAAVGGGASSHQAGPPAHASIQTTGYAISTSAMSSPVSPALSVDDYYGVGAGLVGGATMSNGGSPDQGWVTPRYAAMVQQQQQQQQQQQAIQDSAQYANNVYSGSHAQPHSAPSHQQMYQHHLHQQQQLVALQQQQQHQYSPPTTAAEQQHQQHQLAAYHQQVADTAAGLYGHGGHGAMGAQAPEFTSSMGPPSRTVVPGPGSQSTQSQQQPGTSSNIGGTTGAGATTTAIPSAASPSGHGHGPGPGTSPRLIPPPPSATTTPSSSTPSRSRSSSSVTAKGGATPRSNSASGSGSTGGSGKVKKVKPNRPEDEEFIELDANFVKDSTELFNSLFPNTDKFPDSNTGPGSVKGGKGKGNLGATGDGVGIGIGITTAGVAGVAAGVLVGSGATDREAVGGGTGSGGSGIGGGSPGASGSVPVGKAPPGSMTGGASGSFTSASATKGGMVEGAGSLSLGASPTLTSSSSATMASPGGSSSSVGASPRVGASGAPSTSAIGVPGSSSGLTTPSSNFDTPPTPGSGTDSPSSPKKGRKKKAAVAGGGKAGKSAKAKLLGKAKVSNHGGGVSGSTKDESEGSSLATLPSPVSSSVSAKMSGKVSEKGAGGASGSSGGNSAVLATSVASSSGTGAGGSSGAEVASAGDAAAMGLVMGATYGGEGLYGPPPPVYSDGLPVVGGQGVYGGLQQQQQLGELRAMQQRHQQMMAGQYLAQQHQMQMSEAHYAAAQYHQQQGMHMQSMAGMGMQQEGLLSSSSRYVEEQQGSMVSSVNGAPPMGGLYPVGYGPGSVGGHPHHLAAGAAVGAASGVVPPTTPSSLTGWAG